MYRVSKDVPLPYRIPDSAEDDGSDDEGGGGSTKRSQQRAPATGPHSSVRLRPTKWARKGGAGAGAGGASGAGAGGESGSEGANPESVRRKSLVADLLGRLRQSLLPDGEAEAEGHVGGTGTDARSAAAEGPSLGIDQQGGAKGGAGRDYEPRTPELEGESDLENTGDSEIAHEAERDGDADEDGDTFSIRSDKRGSRLGLGL